MTSRPTGRNRYSAANVNLVGGGGGRVKTIQKVKLGDEKVLFGKKN